MSRRIHMSHMRVARRAGTSNCNICLWGLAVRRLSYSAGVVVLSLASTIVLVSMQTMTALVALTATALIMGGTGHPLSTPQDSPEFINSYTTDANNDYIVLTGFCGAERVHAHRGQHTRAIHAGVAGAMPFDQSVGQGVDQPRPGDQRATRRRVDRRVRLLAKRANRVDPEGQPRRRRFDAAGVVRVDRQPEPTQRRHPSTLRRPRDPHSRSHFRRRDTHRHRLQDRRHHPPVRRLVRLPEQPAQPVRHRECRRGDPLSARRLSERRPRRRAVSGLVRRHRLLHDPEPAPPAADAARPRRGCQVRSSPSSTRRAGAG